jgi:apolipoprotein N-acyltransferase
MNLRKTTLAASLLLTLGFGYKLHLLEEAKFLWGYWSLAFLTPLVVFLAGVFFNINKVENLYKLKYIAGSGLLFGLGFPNSPFTPLMFLGFVPLLFLLEETNSLQSVFKYSFFTFLIFNTFSTWWVSNASLAGGIMANYLNSILMSIPFVLYYFIKKRIKVSLFLLAALWIGFEMLHLRWDMSWPWLTLGNSFSEYPSWIQWYEYTGVMGGTLWIWLVNILVFVYLKDKLKSKLYAALGIVLIPILVSIVIPLIQSKTNNQNLTKVLTIQPNFEPFYEKFDLPESMQVDTCLSLIEKNYTPDIKFIILPETVFSRLQINEAKSNTELNKLVAYMRNKPNSTLLAGIDAYKIVNSPADGNAVRKYTRGDYSTYLEAYNAATAIKSKDSIENLIYYKKSRLVPGPEILPFKSFFRIIAPVFDNLGGTIEGLGIQNERTVFSNENLKIAPVICYESIYGNFMRGYMRNGAQAIAIMTNDGWWDDSPGHLQHMKFAKLRAIEFRKPVIRSANSGISCFIDTYGNIIKSLPYSQRGALTASLDFNGTITFYSRFGDWIGWLVIGLGIGYLSLIILLKPRSNV